MMHEKILGYLAPVLGEATARNLLKHYCIQMHIPIDNIAPSRVPELASAMRPMMAVWLGTAGALLVSLAFPYWLRGVPHLEVGRVLPAVRIAEPLREEREHLRERARIDGRRCVVIEVQRTDRRCHCFTVPLSFNRSDRRGPSIDTVKQ